MTAPRRRWFRFGLRTLFVVVTAVACWLGYQLNWIRERNSFLKNRAPTRIYSVRSLGLPLPEPSRVDAPGMLWLFGEEGRRQIVPNHRADSDEARRLFPEAEIVDLTIPIDDAPETEDDRP